MPPNAEYWHHIYYHGSARTSRLSPWGCEIIEVPWSRMVQLPLTPWIPVTYAGSHLCTEKDYNGTQISCKSCTFLCSHGAPASNMFMENIVSSSSSFRSQATAGNLIEFSEQKVRVLLSPSRFRFVVSYVPRPCRSSPSIAFFFAWHVWCHASSSSWFFVFCLFILSAVFLFFYCRLSILTSDIFSNESDLRIICPKYFNLTITAKVSMECLGLV
jgi:hypothetical protein